MLNILLLEQDAPDNFYPFSIMHCLWEIRCGALRIFEKYEALFPDAGIIYSGRKEWVESFNARFGKAKVDTLSGPTLIFNSTFVPDAHTINKIIEKANALGDENPIKFTCEGQLICAAVNFEYDTKVDEIKEILSNLEFVEKEIIAKKLNYLWNALDLVGESISNDLLLIGDRLNKMSDKYTDVLTVYKQNIFTGEQVTIAPGVVLDASEGPIVIDDGVKIMAQSTIIGPCYIGKKSVVKIGAKIYENSCFGEVCKLGGEIENCIFQAYSNKQHEGFLGHSFIGEWVNLGADTNNSDLKNTYTEITMRLRDEEVKTGRMFLGLLCGDHTKSGINTMFTTGTTAGVCGILVREWFLPNYIKSFSWGGAKNSPAYKVSKAIETAKIVMARRNKQLLDEEIKLLEIEYAKSI